MGPAHVLVLSSYIRESLKLMMLAVAADHACMYNVLVVHDRLTQTLVSKLQRSSRTARRLASAPAAAVHSCIMNQDAQPRADSCRHPALPVPQA